MRKRHVATVSMPLMENSNCISNLLTSLESTVRSCNGNFGANATLHANYMGSMEIRISHVDVVTNEMMKLLEQTWMRANVESRLTNMTVHPDTQPNQSCLHLIGDYTMIKQPSRNNKLFALFLILTIGVFAAFFATVCKRYLQDKLQEHEKVIILLRALGDVVYGNATI